MYPWDPQRDYLQDMVKYSNNISKLLKVSNKSIEKERIHIDNTCWYGRLLCEMEMLVKEDTANMRCYIRHF